MKGTKNVPGAEVEASVLMAIKHGYVRAGSIESRVRTALGHDFAEDPMRAVDRSLQRLRKLGRVRFVAGQGWEVV